MNTQAYEIDLNKKAALRDVSGAALVEMGKKYSDMVVLDADLSTSTKTARFGADFPQRFFNMGISEQNMVGTAAGMATIGLVPFVSSFAIFAVERPFEQIRNSITYPDLNVKIIATHAGLTAGKDGGSHQAVEDISLMRSLPNMSVIVPCDDLEVRQALEYCYRSNGPVYVRMTRMELPRIHQADFVLKPGQGEVLRDGTDVTIATYGSMVIRSLEAASELEKQGVSAAVLNLSTIKPLDTKLITKYAKLTHGIVVAEEHSQYGGLYSALSEFLSQEMPTKMQEVGIMDHFGQTGSPAELFMAYGLTKDNIVKKVKKMLKEKVNCKK